MPRRRGLRSPTPVGRRLNKAAQDQSGFDVTSYIYLSPHTASRASITSTCITLRCRARPPRLLFFGTNGRAFSVFEESLPAPHNAAGAGLRCKRPGVAIINHMCSSLHGSISRHQMIQHCNSTVVRVRSVYKGPTDRNEYIWATGRNRTNTNRTSFFLFTASRARLANSRNSR